MTQHDQSAAIARFIMTAKHHRDSRYLIFDVAKVFSCATGAEIKRGMEIAVELFEAEVMANASVK